MLTLNEWSQRLAAGDVSARSLVEQSLARIMDPQGEGARAFISVSSDSARAQADEVDRRRAAGQSLPVFAGIPLGIKDLFDVAGEVTRAGCTRCPCHRATAGGGLHLHRPQQHDGVRVLRRGLESALRHAVELVRSYDATNTGRIDLRWRRCRSGRHGGGESRH
jgi:hypothetical protein